VSLLLLLSPQGPPPVAFDAVGSSTAAAVLSNSTLTYSHTCSGSNRLLVVSVAVGIAVDTGVTINSVTYAGQPMTQKSIRHSNDQTDGFVAMYYIVAPATGSNNVVITLNGSVTSIESGSASFKNVSQSTPLGSAFTGAGASATPSLAVTGTTVGNMVVDAIVNGNFISSSGQTLRSLNNFDSSTAAGCYADSTAAGNGGTVTMSYAVTADWYALLAAEVKAASGGTDWTQTPVDTSGATDLLFLIRSSVFSDNSVPTDPTIIDRSSAFSDNSVPTDPIALAVGSSPVDVSVPTDSSVVSVGRGISQSDNAVPTDFPVLAIANSPSDNAVPTDQAAFTVGTVRTDDSGTSDSSNVQSSAGGTNWTQTPTDLTGTADSASFSLSPVILDLSVSTDSPVVSIGRGIAQSDNAVPTDVQAYALSNIKSDNAVPTDSFASSLANVRLDDSGTTDSANVQSSAGSNNWTQGSTDSSGLTDSATFSLNLAIVDPSGATDSESHGSSTNYAQTPTDSAGAVDVASLAPALSPNADAVGVTDQSIVTPGRQVAGQDIAWPSDAVALTFSPVQVDQAGVTDPVKFTWTLGPIEPVTVIEQQIWESAHSYSTDQAAPTDSIVVSQGFGILATDIAGSGGWDPTVIGKVWGIPATDDAGVGEYFPFLDHLPAATDQAGLSDSVLLTPGRVEPVGVTDLVTMALGEVDQDDAGLSDPVSVSMNGGLVTQDQAGLTDAVLLARGLVISDPSAPTDVATALRFNDQQQVDPAGLADGARFDAGYSVLDFPIEQDLSAISRGLVAADLGVPSDLSTYDRVSVAADPAGTTDSVSVAKQPGVVDPAGLQDQAVIVVSVALLAVEPVGTSDQAIVSLALKVSVIDSAGVRDVSQVSNGVTRLITIEGSLAPQERILASLASPGRLSAILGLPVPIVVQMAAQGRISVVLADPPRIVAHLEVQP